MNNLPPFPPQQPNLPVIYTQPPLPHDHHPTSWIELGLMGRAFSRQLNINGQVTIILIQNPQFLAQLISEGLHLAMSNYMNHIWVNNIMQPLVPGMNNNLVQAMRAQWNLLPTYH